MSRRTVAWTACWIVALTVLPAAAQTSSLGKQAQTAAASIETDKAPARTGFEAAEPKGNPLLERTSLIALKVVPPKEFKVNDLITIVVRQEKKFEAEGELESRKRFDIKSELEAFFKPIDGGLGATTFYRGHPNVDYGFESRLQNKGDNTREDTFTTRVSGRIVDVKPNGNLIIEAHSRIQHEEEIALVTLTGECRSRDVTPDNTILSTQVADLSIKVDNQGAVRDAASRGWVTRVLDLFKPF